LQINNLLCSVCQAYANAEIAMMAQA